jgi:16S rRNA (uracil1498-N3)-methyltransferase
MSERFFSVRPVDSECVILDGPEAHHLLHVMRAAVGDSVTLFDGRGAEYVAVVRSLARSHVELRINERNETSRELAAALIVGVALPKGDRQKWLVEKLTELGVTKLVPLSTERGVAQPTAATLDRLRRSVIEASKQCGRNRLMQIDEPLTWAAWVSNYCLTGESLGDASAPVPPRRLVAHPGSQPLVEFELRPTLATQLAVGPEGGLTDAEVAKAVAAGWQTVDLGPRTLRVETAAIALAAALSLCSSRGCRSADAPVD